MILSVDLADMGIKPDVDMIFYPAQIELENRPIYLLPMRFFNFDQIDQFLHQPHPITTYIPPVYTPREIRHYNVKRNRIANNRSAEFIPWGEFRSPLGLGPDDEWVERDGLQADGARRTKIPSVYTGDNEAGMIENVYWYLFSYFTEVEMGGFLHGTAKPLEFAMERFGTNRYRCTDVDACLIGVSQPRGNDLNIYSAATRSYMGGVNQVANCCSFFGGVDQVPKIDDQEFNNRLNTLFLNGSSFRVTELAYEVISQVQRQAGAQDLARKVSEITSKMGSPIMLSDVRSLSAYTVAEFLSPTYEVQQEGEKLGDAQAWNPPFEKLLAMGHRRIGIRFSRQTQR